MHMVRKIIASGFHRFNVLPCRSNGAQPVSQAHGVEGSAAARVFALVVRRAPALSPEFVVFIQEQRRKTLW